MSLLKDINIVFIFILKVKYPIQFGEITVSYENNTKHIGTL